MAEQIAHDRYLATRYFPFFDGIRYLLVLIVVIDHAGKVWPVLNGGVAVLVFFVMSGYLITTLLCRERARGRVDIRAFIRRRAYRIVPLYYATIACYLVLMATIRWPPPEDFGSVWRHLAFLSEYTPSLTFGQAWSLGIEEKFYLLWPALGFVVIRRGTHRLMLAGVLFLIFSVFWLWPATHLQHYASIMAGCLLALILHSERGFGLVSRFCAGPAAMPAILAAAAACWFTLCYSEQLDLTALPLPITELATAGLPAAVAAGFGWVLVRRLGVVPLLGAAALRYGGRLSYGIYLTHGLSVLALYAVAPGRYGSGPGWIIPIAVIVATCAAMPGHHLIEIPMIARGRRRPLSERLPIRLRSVPGSS